jgi:ribosome biogenesis GTPase
VKGKPTTAFVVEDIGVFLGNGRHVQVEGSAIAPDWGDAKPNGLVLSQSGRWAFVNVDGQEWTCLIDEKLMRAGPSCLAPGDAVFVISKLGQPIVKAVAPRRSKLSRLVGRGSRAGEQVVAANVDVLVMVASMIRPPFRPGLIDRYLIVAQLGGVRAALCLNKMDLAEVEPTEIPIYRELGVTVIPCSCVTGQGLEELRRELRGRLSVLAGHSGVGKSTIINCLDPRFKLTTREVSPGSKRGRYTTSSARLYEIHGDIRIIDTPGIKQLGLWGVSYEELAFYFPEWETYARSCRFRDCTHIHEPRCAVRAAVEAGEVAPQRYASYLRIRGSLHSQR